MPVKPRDGKTVYQEAVSRYGRDYFTKKAKEWHGRNPNYRSPNLAESNKRRGKKYKDKNREAMRKYCLDYLYANPERYARYRANRRVGISKATPAWADHSKIKEIYERARSLGKETGIEYHVDHIIPLLGGTVCGLHVEHNLRIVTKSENLSKGNVFSDGSVSYGFASTGF